MSGEPVHPDVARGQRQVDAAVAMMAGFDVEQRVAIPFDLSEELSWLDEERLHEEVHAVSGGSVEGEEENGTYVLLSTGMPLKFLRELVDELIGEEYETTIVPAPQWAAANEQIVIGRRSRT